MRLLSWLLREGSLGKDNVVMVRFNIKEYPSCTSNDPAYFGLMQSFEQGSAVVLPSGDTSKAQSLPAQM